MKGTTGAAVAWEPTGTDDGDVNDDDDGAAVAAGKPRAAPREDVGGRSTGGRGSGGSTVPQGSTTAGTGPTLRGRTTGPASPTILATLAVTRARSPTKPFCRRTSCRDRRGRGEVGWEHHTPRRRWSPPNNARGLGKAAHTRPAHLPKHRLQQQGHRLVQRAQNNRQVCVQRLQRGTRFLQLDVVPRHTLHVLGLGRR